MYVSWMEWLKKESSESRGKGTIEWPTEPNREVMNALERVYIDPGDILRGKSSFGSVKKLQNFMIYDFWHVRDKTVQVKLTNKLSTTATKSSCIDMSQSTIESLNNVLSYAYPSVAIILFVHKL
jgi:hypothetical protein